MARPASQPHRHMSRRAFLRGALATGSLGLLAGCAPVEEESSGSAVEVAEEEAEVEPVSLCISSPSCIDPYNCADDASLQVVSLLFDSLTSFNYQTGEVEGLAAESWEVSDDATRFTFHLVGGATFHNGEAVTSAAFKRAWERIVNPGSTVAELYGESEISNHLALIQGYEELREGGAGRLAGISCPDDETLVVTLSTPYADFPSVVAHPALAPVPELAHNDPEAFYAAPIGNGPFELVEETEWTEGSSLDLVRFDGYAGEPATIASVHLEVTTDIDAAYRSFESGDLDITAVPIDELSQAKKDYGLAGDGCTIGEDERVIIGSEPVTCYLVCNTSLMPLDNLDVRRGLSLAIDRESICEDIYRNIRIPADGIVPPCVAGYREGAWEFSTYDEEQATECWERAYPADEDGDRDLSLELMYYTDGGHDELVAAIVDDLARMGVTIETDPEDWDTMLERYASGDFELALATWTADYPVLDNVLYPLFHSDSIGGNNRSGYSDDDADAAMTEARSTVDDEARIAALQEVDATVGSAMPVVPLMYHAHVVVGSERIEYLYCDPMGCCDLATVQLEK